MIGFALLLDENCGVFVSCFIGRHVLYHSTDNGSLTQSGFLGTYEDTVQDVTV